MNASSGWPRNRLLLALPSRNLKRLMPELEQIRETKCCAKSLTSRGLRIAPHSSTSPGSKNMEI
jgi:hypothetical protein